MDAWAGQALGSGAAYLATGVGAHEALRDGESERASELAGDRCSGVEATPAVAEGVGWDGDEGGERDVARGDGRDGLGGHPRQGEALAELQGGDEAARDVLVGRGRPGGAAPGNGEVLRRARGDCEEA